MKKLFLALLVFTVQLGAADLDFTFDYGYVIPGCIDADVNCIVGFEIRDEKDGSVVAVATATPGASTPAIDIPATATGYVRLGNRTFAAYAIARDNEGAQIESLKSVEVNIVIRPFPATNVRVSQK